MYRNEPRSGPGARTRLADKVAALMRPDAYPERPARIEPVETHMSWVFLTEAHAYKLKKPVRTAYLDYARLAARHRFCQAEVDLNRALAPDVYLGVVPLVRDEAGRLRVAAAGEVVDWLVKTRRLPAGRMLDRAIREGTVGDDEIVAVVRKLARFYAGAPKAALTPESYVARLTSDAAENFAALRETAFDLSGEALDAAEAALARILGAESEMLAARVRAGRVVEGHGDLRPEHVVLEPEPKIIDRLEFSRTFREVDALDEIAYLALECDRLGAARIGRLVLDTYLRVAPDPAPERLVAFYQCFRACLRAKLAAWHTNEPRADGAERWLARARDYLAAAARAARALG